MYFFANYGQDKIKGGIYLKNIGRTDLALEDYEKSYKDEIYEYEINGYQVSKIEVSIENSKKIKKEAGLYYTITFNSLLEFAHDEEDAVSDVLKEILIELMKEMDIKENPKVFVVGLGNAGVTADSLGPLVCSKLLVSKHLVDLNINEYSLGNLSAIAPGVMGQTGIQTSDIVSAIVKKIKPDLVIVVDALAARNLKRLNRTIQITNTFIKPGAGIGNRNSKAISKDSLGCNVIAIGVPTVVEIASILVEVDSQKVEELIDDELNYAVSCKEIDEMVRMLADIISKAINLTIHDLVKYE